MKKIILQKQVDTRIHGTWSNDLPNHGFAVDYFELGVIGYEFKKGVRPYNGKNRKEIKEKIFNKEVKNIKDEIPKGWNIESADYINRLLKKRKLID